MGRSRTSSGSNRRRPAEWLVRPDDVADLRASSPRLDPDAPLFPVGVGSNLIVRDGGLPGVTVRLLQAVARRWR